MDVSRILIGLGLLLLIAGLAWPILSRLGLGNLPGDIVIRRDGFSLYVPIMTSLIISVVLTLILWFASRGS